MNIINEQAVIVAVREQTNKSKLRMAMLIAAQQVNRGEVKLHSFVDVPAIVKEAGDYITYREMFENLGVEINEED